MDKEEVKTNVSSLLVATKGAITPHQLNRDHRSVLGCEIPFRKLGFKSLEEFLISIPDIAKISLNQGGMVVQAVPTKESAHIFALVQNQKRAKGKPKAFQKPILFRPPATPYAVSRQQYIRRSPGPPNTVPWNTPKFSGYRVASTVHVPPHSTVNAYGVIPPPHSTANSYGVIPPPGSVPHTSAPPPFKNGANLANRPPVPAPNPFVYSAPPPKSAIPFRPPTASQGAETSSRDKLARLVKSKNLGDINYQNVPTKFGRYIGTVTVAKKKFTSYPEEFAQIDDAYEFAARDAYDNLANAGRELPVTNLPNVIAQRVIDIVGEKPTGYWSLSLVEKYTEVHREQLPTNWVQIVSQESDAVVFEAVAENHRVYPRQSTNPPTSQHIARTKTEAVEPSPFIEQAIPAAKLITQRVIEIVGAEKSKGYWSQSLVDKYAQLFGEKLPANWVEMVSQVSDSIVFDPVGQHYHVCLKKHHIQPVLKQVAQSKEAKNLTAVDPVLYGQQLEPIPASLPESGTLLVHILVVHAADRVALRRMDSEQYAEWEDMINEMEIFYTEKETVLPQVSKLDPNTLYAAKVDGTWLRIQLHRVIDATKVEVTLVDYADFETIPVSDVYPLLNRFGQIPCQGMMCHLYGLSPFAVSDVAIEAEIDLFLNQQFIAQIVTEERQVSLILYEASSGREINMNEKILTKVAEKTNSVSLQVGLIPEVFLSYVSSTGDLFILRDTPQQDVVDSLVSMISLHIDNFPVETNLAPGRMYFGRSPKHDWCRMALCGNLSQDGSVAVQLIDFGEIEIVAGDTLRDIIQLSPVLARIPAQATRVRLVRVPPSPMLSFTEKAANRLREMAPPQSPLMMRVCEIQQLTGTPVVELYERLENQKLVYINASMEMDESLFRPINSSNASTPISPAPPSRKHSVDDEKLLCRQFASITRTFSTNAGQQASSERKNRTQGVKQVIVPDALFPTIDPGQNKPKFNVHVCNVSNPRLFYVQPLASLNELSKLMHELQEYTKKPEMEKVKLDSSSVLVNGFYAAWHAKTQLYHRVQMKHNFGSDYLVNFIDYGDNEVVQLGHLLPLPYEFSLLPAQAIKAQLSGVKPIDSDWSVDDALFFKEKVDRKDYCCYVMDILPENTIKLQMIDVSGVNDVMISQFLIDTRHALPA